MGFWLNDQIRELLFPKQCVGCGKMGEFVCSECSVGMWEEEQICPGCRRANRYGLLHPNCKSPLSGLICLWAYEGLTRKLIQKIKYGSYYDFLSELLVTSDRLSVRPEFYYFNKFLLEKPTVVPVPLHANRLRKRGFNQAEMIAKLVFSDQLSVINNLLVRIKDTEQQVGRTREVRLQNMYNAFAINSKHQIPTTKQTPNYNNQNPKFILLVDDVWTTGATMTEAARVLKREGVRKIWGFVLAR